MEKARILVEGDFNSKVRVFHTTLEISADHSNTFYRPLRDRSHEYLANVGDVGSGIVRSVLEIDGVVRVSIQPYLLCVEIGPAFRWEEEINERVLGVLLPVYLGRGLTKDDIELITGWKPEKQ